MAGGDPTGISCVKFASVPEITRGQFLRKNTSQHPALGLGKVRTTVASENTTRRYRVRCTEFALRARGSRTCIPVEAALGNIVQREDSKALSGLVLCAAPMPLRRVLLACGAALAASLSVQSDRGAALKLLVPQDTAFKANPFTDSSQLPFKPADPSTCTSIENAANNAWCVSTCATACPPQQCKCEGEYTLVAAGGTTGEEAKANAEAAAAAREEAVSKTMDAAEAAKAAIANANAKKIAESENPAENPATPQDSFKPADPRTCKSIVAQVTDDWCISTCATACLPQQCKCEGGADTPVLATTSPGQASGEPAVGSKEYLCQTHGQCDQPILPAATVPAGVADPADPSAGTSEHPSATIPAGSSMTDATVAPAPAPADPAADAAAVAIENAKAHAPANPNPNPDPNPNPYPNPNPNPNP